MAETAIEWTERSWNPIVGCTVVSPGCTNCYAMKMADRLEAMAPKPDGKGNPHLLHYRGTTTRGQFLSKPPVWTGKVAMAPAHVLLEPLRRRKPTTWFVNSMGDLFHEDVPDVWIDRVFAVMALCPQHTFQVLTKRAARMQKYLTEANVRNRLAWENVTKVADLWAPQWKDEEVDGPHRSRAINAFTIWPLPNVWLGVSAEDQRRADERIPDLLATPAAIRFVSAEPLLGLIDFQSAWHGENALDSECWGDCAWCDKGLPPLHNCQRHRQSEAVWNRGRSGLDWIIVGGESGPGARPMHPDWARQIRDQCAAAGTAFFFKQWGEWWPEGQGIVGSANTGSAIARADRTIEISGRDIPFDRSADHSKGEANLWKVGKKRAGRLLDGAMHSAMPEARQ